MTPEYVFAVASKIPPSKSQIEHNAKHWPEYKLTSALTGWDGITAKWDYIEWASDYAEPGYTNGRKGILFGNWNHVSSRVQDILERMGYSLEWEDEWTTCSECGKAVRTNPDCYSWQRSYWEPEDSGEVICCECINPEEYLASLHNKVRQCSTVHTIDPSKHGYVRLRGDFESGWHPHQNDDPRTIYKQLRDSGEKRPLIFVLDTTGQFDIGFSVWAKLDDDTEQDSADQQSSHTA